MQFEILGWVFREVSMVSMVCTDAVIRGICRWPRYHSLRCRLRRVYGAGGGIVAIVGVLGGVWIGLDGGGTAALRRC